MAERMLFGSACSHLKSMRVLCLPSSDRYVMGKLCIKNKRKCMEICLALLWRTCCLCCCSCWGQDGRWQRGWQSIRFRRTICFTWRSGKNFFESLGNSTIKRTKVEVGSNGVPSLKKSLSPCRCTDFLFCLFDFLSFDSLSFLNNTN